MDINKYCIIIKGKVKTADIEYIKQNGDLWIVKFKNSEKCYSYKSSDVRYLERRDGGIFEYLEKIADLTKLANDDGKEVNLSKYLNEIKEKISAESVLWLYLNPNHRAKSYKLYSPLIFPFGSNSSQLKAVNNALINQLSIIQGPPGTGKTQTILNIIANLLLQDRSVLIVSNNNSATLNVYEKLEKNKFEFFCATLGKKENVDKFFANQAKEYPAILKDWQNNTKIEKAVIAKHNSILKDYFKSEEELAKSRMILSQIECEYKHYKSQTSNERYFSKRINKMFSDEIMETLEKLKLNYYDKKLGFFRKSKIKRKLKLKKIKIKNLDIEKLIDTLQFAYYDNKIKELNQIIDKCEKIISKTDVKQIYEKHKSIFQKGIAEKFSAKKERDIFTDTKDMESFIKEYPVVLSTTFSSTKTLGFHYGDFLFDYVIMDESSQVDIITGVLALSCAKNAVIVGDKKQLPNVIESKLFSEIKEINNELGIDDRYSFFNSFLSSCEKVLPNTPQTLLREHYRCEPAIIEFCNRQFYNNQLLIMKKSNGKENPLEIIKTPPGNFCNKSIGHLNERQIEVVREIISENNYPKNDIGIMAPYRTQVEAIKDMIGEEYEVATVHKFQGKEKKHMIISTVDDEISEFTDNPNMLNVAISRAEEKLSIIINGNNLDERTNYAQLVKYIEYNQFKIRTSSINSVFDFLFNSSTKNKFDLLSSSKKVSKFASENAMHALLNEIFSQERFNCFSAVFEMPLKNYIDKRSDKLKDLPDELKDYISKSYTHCDFTIYSKVTKDICFGIEVDGYTYHKEGTNQAERDKKKDQFFEILGIPLLRFSTRGVNEKEIIINELEKYIPESPKDVSEISSEIIKQIR